VTSSVHPTSKVYRNILERRISGTSELLLEERSLPFPLDLVLHRFLVTNENSQVGVAM
jgi:hypothetical protein